MSRRASVSRAVRRPKTLVSSRFCRRLPVGEAATFLRELLEERRRLEGRLVETRGEFAEPLGDFLEADAIGIMHGAAAIDRPTIAVHPDHVDIAGAEGHP